MLRKRKWVQGTQTHCLFSGQTLHWNICKGIPFLVSLFVALTNLLQLSSAVTSSRKPPLTCKVGPDPFLSAHSHLYLYHLCPAHSDLSSGRSVSTIGLEAP